MSAETISSKEASRYLSFALGQEQYAIPLLSVKEVIAIPDMTSIPGVPGYFQGIMNLRGQIISVMDLCLKLGIKAERGSESAVIICDLGNVSLGVIVSSVESVLSISKSEIQPLPETSSLKNTKYIHGVVKTEKNLVVLLDIASALDVKDLVAIQNTQPTAKAV